MEKELKLTLIIAKDAAFALRFALLRQSKFPNLSYRKLYIYPFCSNIMVGVEPKKGVSPVIASVLMVVIAIVLVGFAYTMFSGMAKTAGTAGTRAMGEMEKSYQKLEIVTAIYNTSNNKLCFKIRAPGSNTLTIPIEGYMTYLIDGQAVTVTNNLAGCPITGTPNCTDTGLDLSPGDSCYGAVTWTAGYPYLFEIQHDWGAYDSIAPTYT